MAGTSGAMTALRAFCSAMPKIVSGRDLLNLGRAFGLDGGQHLFRGGRQRKDAHADRVMNGVQYCGGGRDRGRFTDTFGAERSGWIEALHDVDPVSYTH